MPRSAWDRFVRRKSNEPPFFDEWGPISEDLVLRSYRPVWKRVSAERIIGTTAHHTGRLFNSDWTPKPYCLEERRWMNLYTAALEGKDISKLSPSTIRLYQTPDGSYWVAGDGNHRVSVAKTLGITYLWAEVFYLDEPGARKRRRGPTSPSKRS